MSASGDPWGFQKYFRGFRGVSRSLLSEAFQVVSGGLNSVLTNFRNGQGF